MNINTRASLRQAFWNGGSRAGCVFQLLAVVFAVWLVSWLAWGVLKSQIIKHGTPEAFRQLYGEVPALPRTDRPIPVRKGNINGVPIAVPSNYLYFPFEYNDQSIWEARKPGDKRPEERGFADAVGAFAPNVRWPDLKPRSPETEQSFWNRKKPGGDPWLFIGVVDNGPNSSIPKYGWAPHLRGLIKRLAERPQRRYLPPKDPKGFLGDAEDVQVHYELRGVDPATGLQWAEPVGPGVETFETWNYVLYWQGDIDGHVSDLVECRNGRMPNPSTQIRCEHNFELPEWGAAVDVSYRRDLLPQWREIKARTRELLLSFQVDTITDSVVEPPVQPEGK